MLVLLEKGRPAAPEGTRRQHVQMRKGVPTKVWVKKLGKKWVYDGTVDPKNKSDNVGKRSRVRKEHNEKVARNDKVEKEITLLVGEVPSYDFVKQEHMKSAVASADSPRLSLKLSSHLSDVVGIPIRTLKDIQDIGLGDLDNADGTAYRKLYFDGFGAQARGIAQNSGSYNTYWSAQSLLANSRHLSSLADPRYDGKMKIDNLYPENSSAQGLRVTMGTNVGAIPDVIVPWGLMEEFVNTWATETVARVATGQDGSTQTSAAKKAAATVIRKAKKSDGYKQWQVTGDPEIADAVSSLSKTTGMDVNAASFYGRGKTQLKKAYITKIDKTFKTLKAGVDLSKYTPPDGKKLKIRVTGATGKAAGFYSEHDQSINIAPSMPGTISHEVGHYLWERHPAMQKEFMDWVKDSGLMDKIEKQTKGKMSPAEKSRHIDHAMNVGMKVLLEQMAQPAGPPNPKYYLQPAAIDGLRVLTNIMRHSMHDDSIGSEWVNTPVAHLKSMADGDLQSLAQSAVSKGYYPSADPMELGTQLKALKDGVHQLHNISQTTLTNQISHTAKLAVEGKPPSDRRFRTQSAYWEKPTEIFARTFRNYVAMKDGQKIFDTANDQNQAYTSEQVKKNPHGWGFPEIDPSVDMMNSDNNRLQQILKHHIGGTVMKAMLDNISKSRHSDLATQLAEEGLYKDGMSVDFDPDELAAGIKVEMEHTTDPAVAEEIAKDHLVEDDKYYSKLKEIEKADDDDDEDEEGSERDQAFERESKNEAAKDANEEAKIQKSGPKVVFVLEKAKKAAVGATSADGKRKKVAEGEWVGVRMDTDPKEKRMDAIMDGAARRNLSSVPAGVRRTIEIFLDRRKTGENVTMRPSYQILQKMIYSAEQDPSTTVRKKGDSTHIDTDAGTISVKLSNNKQFISYNSATPRVGATLTPEELAEYEKLMSSMEKAKPYPNGTVRKHSGRTMIKKDGGWVPASAGEASQTPEAKESKSRKPVKAAGGTPKNTIQGSPEMFTALVKVGGGKAPYLDDLNGKARGIYNSMTKAGLIRWVHLAEEEYRPELTDAGRKALDTGQALTIKTKREKKTTKKKPEKKS